MKRKSLIVLVLILVLLATCSSCNSKSVDLGQLGGSLLKDILADVASPDNIAALLKLPGSEAKVNFVVQLGVNRVKLLAVELKGAADSGDQAALDAWLQRNLPEILPLLQDHSATEILRTVDRISPDLAATLKTSVPIALEYLYSHDRIDAATLDALVQSYQNKRLVVADDELAAFAELVESEYNKAKRLREFGVEEF